MAEGARLESVCMGNYAQGSAEGTPSEESLPLRETAASGMEYHAYILRSLADGGYYYGSAESIIERLNIHNSGKVRSTKGRRPFIRHYSERYSSRSEAMKRERFFKSPSGWKWLKENNII